MRLPRRLWLLAMTLRAKVRRTIRVTKSTQTKRKIYHPDTLKADSVSKNYFETCRLGGKFRDDHYVLSRFLCCSPPSCTFWS